MPFTKLLTSEGKIQTKLRRGVWHAYMEGANKLTTAFGNLPLETFQALRIDTDSSHRKYNGRREV